MRAFVLQVCLFGFLLSGICTAVYHTGLFSAFLPSERVYETIEKSKQKSPAVRRLIIGDSVGDQLFGNFYQSSGNTLSLASNQAIDIIGQYILLHNYLQVNEHVEEVYLVYNPFSFKNNLDHEFTFNYFLKPFLKDENQMHFTQTARLRIEQLPFSDLAGFPPVAITFWTPELEVNAQQQVQMFLSAISKEYLLKMQHLADQKQVKFKVVAPPIKYSRKSEVETLAGVAQMELQEDARLALLFESYFDSMQYLQDEQFVDQIHLKEPAKYTAVFLEQIIDGNDTNLLAVDEK